MERDPKPAHEEKRNECLKLVGEVKCGREREEETQ
jgi:hypothetical protein